MCLDSPASCIDYSPDGELLIVGFGHQKGRWKTVEHLSSNETNDEDGKLEGKRGRLGSKGGKSHIEGHSSIKNGGFIVLNQADFVTTFEARDTKKVCLWRRGELVSTFKAPFGVTYSAYASCWQWTCLPFTGGSNGQGAYACGILPPCPIWIYSTRLI